MNPSSDNGSNFFESVIAQHPQRHHCRDVDMNNNCACVVTNDDRIDEDSEGDELAHRKDHQLVANSIDQLPLLIRSALAVRRRRRQRKPKSLRVGVIALKHVVTIEQLISRIEAVSHSAGQQPPKSAPPAHWDRRGETG